MPAHKKTEVRSERVVILVTKREKINLEYDANRSQCSIAEVIRKKIFA